MKKIMILFALIMVSFALLGCKDEPVEEIDLDTKKEETYYPYESLSDEDFDISKHELKDIPFVFAEKIYRLNSYKKSTIGETIAKVLISYHQSINDSYVKNKDENHLLIKSESSLQKVFHEAYFYQDDIKYRDKENNELINISYDDYINLFGLLPWDRSLEGFVLTLDSVISIEEIYNDNDYYEYKIVIDSNIGSQKIKQRMKTFGDLKDDPVFSYVEMTLVMKEDFTPIEIRFIADYVIKYPLLGKMKCHQEYVSKYEIDDDNI